MHRRRAGHVHLRAIDANTVHAKELDLRKPSFGVAVALAIMTGSAAACMSEDAATEGHHASEIGAGCTASAFALHIETEGRVILSAAGSPDDSCWGGCDKAHLAGAQVSLTAPFDRPDCLVLSGWTGACAGQFSPCTLTMNSDLSTQALWTFVRGCSPF